MNRREFLTTATLSSIALATRAAETTRQFRVAVIGHTGRGDYGHGLDALWFAHPETEIVAIADADEKGRAAAQKKLKLATGFADYHRMLAETKPDIVAICPRWIDQHRDMAMAAIEAGARGIYMEKPFCRTPAEADEIVAACDKRNVKFALAHRNRYHPALPAVARLLKDGAIGRLLEIRSRGKEDQRGGVEDLWVLGSHVFNLINFFCGNPVACSAELLNKGRPVVHADIVEGREGIGPVAGDELHARFEMENGVPAFFDSIRNADTPSENYGLQLIGSRGIISMRIDQHPIAHLISGAPFKPLLDPRAWQPISSAGAGVPEPIADAGAQVSSHGYAVRDLLAAIREDRQPLCNARDGRVVVEMICAILESHRLGGARIPWPLQTRRNPLALF